MRGWFHEFAYSCARARELMYDYLEADLAPLASFRFQWHLRSCRACRDYLGLYRMAADYRGFRASRPPPPDSLRNTLRLLDGQGITREKR